MSRTALHVDDHDYLLSVRENVIELRNRLLEAVRHGPKFVSFSTSVGEVNVLMTGRSSAVLDAVDQTAPTVWPSLQDGFYWRDGPHA